jgi:hypothetical protein
MHVWKHGELEPLVLPVQLPNVEGVAAYGLESHR